jgi:predicted RNA-binding Zn-ribbon protein involved in translation (DUF1610 family)
MKKFFCPKCGKKEMVKQEAQKRKYIFICKKCGFKQGMLSKDRKQGVR